MKSKVTKNSNVEIIKLPAESWEEFKHFRILALLTNQSVFGEPAQKAIDRTDLEWQERMRKSVEGKVSSMFFARNMGKLVGMAGWYRSDVDLVSGSAQLWGAFVLPEFRKRGIARQLLNSVLEELHKNIEVRVARLEINEQNTASLSLCLSQGFVETGSVEEVLGDGVMHVVKQLEYRLR